MSSGYWTKLYRDRISRRRMLAATGATALGASILIACGGDDDDDGTVKGDSSGLLTQPRDTTKSAKQGGVLASYRDREVGHGDPYYTQRTAPGTAWTFSRLFVREPGYLKTQPSTFIGDMVESFELTPDNLEMTIKLRPSSKWHDIEPVNAREVEAEDVAFSFQRLGEVGVNRELLVNSVNPSAPIESITAIDSKTAIIKMASPSAGLFGLLSGSISGYLWLMPREAATYEPRELLIGSGPWQVKGAPSSVQLDFQRNAGWHGAESLFIDEVRQTILPEYAAGLAQFRAGNIYNFALNPEDILATKRDLPELKMYALDPTAQSRIAFFGWNPSYGDETPFRDQRLRQAFSMAIDRDLWIRTFFGVDSFESEGIPMVMQWNSAIPTIWPGWWLDPRGDDLGDAAKYYQRNVAEATKLVAASGYSGGDIKAQYITTGQYGADFTDSAETLIGFASEAGIKLVTSPVDWSTEWRPKVADAQGDFEGMSFRAAAGFQIPDVGEFSFAMFHKDGGGNYTGFFGADSSFQGGDPRINDLLEQVRAEFDLEERQSLMHEVQRIMAEQQYIVAFPGSASVFELTWPILQNQNVWSSGNVNNGLWGLPHVGQWLDETKAPVNKTA